MHIFVDLDGTLFNTPKLGADTALLLEKDFGISPDDYEAARQEMFVMNNRIYSAELHARRLAKRVQFDEPFLVKYFIDLFNNENSEEYVYDESADFLERASQLGPLIILTYGEAFVQTPRAIKSGLSSLVNDVVVTQHNKADTIVEYFQPDEIMNQKITLIDDSLEHLEVVKDRFANSITVHLTRNSVSQSQSRHQQAVSLSEVIDFIL